MTDQANPGTSSNLPLGKEVSYPEHYDASVLCPISRQQSRQTLGIEPGTEPFVGEDIWNAYELSWLDAKGKPMVAQAEFRFKADSPAIVESKSFKLYLNSLNQTRFESRAALAGVLSRDLSAVASGPVEVALFDVDHGSFSEISGFCVDSLDIEVSDYAFNAELLGPDAMASADIRDEVLYSHLLRSLCPVTGQPDWATLVVAYTGQAIDREGLLRYIISYRQHQEFHEQCVERIYMDILARCRPERLQVYARYVRRGGLDINPYRSSCAVKYPNIRLARQ